MKQFSIFFALFSVSLAVTECDVYPCSRDVVIVFDNTVHMGSVNNTIIEIDFIKRLLYGWNFGLDEIFYSRVAITGVGVLNLIDTSPYYTSYHDALNILNTMQVEAEIYGQENYPFNEVVEWLVKKYGSPYPNPARDNVQKRIIIFTAEPNATAISGAQSYIDSLYKVNFRISVIPLTAASTIEFHRLKNIEKVYENNIIGRELPDSLIPELITNSICNGQTTTCPTKTLPVITTQVGPTTPPLEKIDQFLNCSCTSKNLYLDIIVMIDVSKSMAAEKLSELEYSIASMVYELTVDANIAQSVRMGIITFAGSVKKQFNLGSLPTDSDIFDALFSLTGTSEVHWNLVNALSAAELMFEKNKRGKVQRVILLYSSTYNDDSDPATYAASLKENGINIITVAIEPRGEHFVHYGLTNISSPKMNFEGTDSNGMDEVLWALCQSNCYCQVGWDQLTGNDVRFAQCFWHSENTTNWNTASSDCKSIASQQNSMLVCLESQHKEMFVRKFAHDNQQNSYTYHIGLKYFANHYQWEDRSVIEDISYTNWASSYPKSADGQCVGSYITNGFNYQWKNEDCKNSKLHYICQAEACDTDHFCPYL